MTSDYFLYLQNSAFMNNEHEPRAIRDRLIPMSKIKRIWVYSKYFIVAQEGYDDLYVEKVNDNETILDFYKRAYVPIPSQVVIDSNT